MIKHIINVVKSKIHEIKKNTLRSPAWPEVEKRFLALNPNCAACGGKIRLQVHHIKPFHLHPELELKNDNLITLCMSEKECHLLIGHGGNFKAYNPNVIEDSAKLFLNSDLRTTIVENAKKNRVML